MASCLNPDLPLEGQRVLVVEDDYLVAAMLVEQVQGAGGRVVGPIGSLHSALRFLERDDNPLHSALIDLNLHGNSAYPLADALLLRGVRVVFITGYEQDSIELSYRHLGYCPKPCTQRVLVNALRT
jgi:CheY-like chemotaxis protein